MFIPKERLPWKEQEIIKATEEEVVEEVLEEGSEEVVEEAGQEVVEETTEEVEEVVDEVVEEVAEATEEESFQEEVVEKESDETNAVLIEVVKTLSSLHDRIGELESKFSVLDLSEEVAELKATIEAKDVEIVELKSQVEANEKEAEIEAEVSKWVAEKIGTLAPKNQTRRVRLLRLFRNQRLLRPLTHHLKSAKAWMALHIGLIPNRTEGCPNIIFPRGKTKQGSANKCPEKLSLTK